MTKAASDDRFHLERELLDARALGRVLRRMAGEIVEREPEIEQAVLVGIRTRGLPLAERLAASILEVEGFDLPIGALDITLYRDDLSTIAPQPVVKGTHLPFPIENRIVLLVDDVLYTGRTVRAALDELKDYGRPSAVRLAVLVDRGHRELPIRAEIVGKEVETSRDQMVEVGFEETDGSDYVRLWRRISSEA